MQKKYLMTPGPTPVPAEVLLKMASPMIHHRTPDFSAAFRASIEGLKYVFDTERSDVMLFASSGTGAMESAIVNTLSAGDTVIIARNGKFGDRQKQICQAYGVKVEDLEYEWTQTVKPADIEAKLAALAAEGITPAAVIVTQSETSTGVLNDVKAIGAIVKNYPDTILIVDSITGIGAVECKTDEWGLDVVMTGSQKGLMLPPGLAALTVSPKAWKAYERSTLPKFYFDWMKYKKSVDKDTTPFTPAVSLVLGLNVALAMIREEGLENTIARHSRLAEATRKGCEALGLEIFAPEDGRSSAVTPVWVPEGIDGKQIVSVLKNRYGVTIAGGQDHLVGKIIRIGHLGYFGEFDIITTLSALEMTLASLGYEFERGSGIKAAEEVFMAE
ncbi:MAG: alanine--glyoxylate aminotransferase family protein [Coriobacteriia bacterium]|nr:alanine--glyoxylate aminotransferase family protein [Coriobacteriia bacterium]